ncbi:MAG: DUF4145 domain-containing protein [Alphaproteobacteria bacterium]
MTGIGRNWRCPYCGHDQVLSEERFEQQQNYIYVQGCDLGLLGYVLEAIICANQKCRKLSLDFDLHERGEERRALKGRLDHWKLLPPSSAKPQPEYIPAAIRSDYMEACAIRDLSPKASATLARRCIQGMIRDFCGITEGRLIDEIEKLREHVLTGRAPPGVQKDSIESIDAVRRVGNIGAHMEKDVNVIVDVEPDEAQLLIELIELLMEEWYVARHDRTERLRALEAVAAAKDAARKGKPA